MEIGGITIGDDELRETYDKYKPVIGKIAEDYLSEIGTQVAHSCHSVSNGFIGTWQTLPIAKAFKFAVTIGNVRYKGKDIYGATTQTVMNVLQAGQKAGVVLPVHVWLTLDDMTVFDLTIKSSLRMMGYQDINDEKKVLVWRDGERSDYEFEPLYVDNDFFSRVDTGRTYQTRCE